MTAEPTAKNHDELLPAELRDAGYVEIGHLAVFTNNIIIASRVGAMAPSSKSTHGAIKDPVTANLVYWCLLGLVEDGSIYQGEAS